MHEFVYQTSFLSLKCSLINSEDDKTPAKYEKVEQRNGCSHNCNDLHQRALNQKMEDTQFCQNNNNNNVNGNIDKKTPNGVLKNNCDIGENFKEADDGKNKIEVGLLLYL